MDILVENRPQGVIGMLSGGGVLGIFGMCGIGKTTLAKELFNTISRNFESSCFVENVRGFPSHTLDEHVRSCFHGSGEKLDGTKIQWGDLKEEKTLIVMDDVDSVSQLKVLPELKHVGDESCFIITSRNMDVLKLYEKFYVYEVAFLDRLSAKKLFCHHAFGLEEIPDSIAERSVSERNVQAVVDKCGGLPLTLEVLGRHLRGREDDAKIWEEAIDKLGEAEALSDKDDDFWASLQLTYEALSEEEQQMFTDAATFFFERPLDEAFAAWTASFENPESSWANLVSRSMVKEVFKAKKKKKAVVFKVVWVHEHLRDLATKVLRSEALLATHGKGKERASS